MQTDYNKARTRLALGIFEQVMGRLPNLAESRLAELHTQVAASKTPTQTALVDTILAEENRIKEAQEAKTIPPLPGRTGLLPMQITTHDCVNSKGETINLTRTLRFNNRDDRRKLNDSLLWAISNGHKVTIQPL